MKRLIVLFALLTIFISGCSAEKVDTKPSPVKINLPTDNTVNGYRISDGENVYSSIPDVIDASEVGIVSSVNINTTEKSFCGNKNSKVFHISSCGSVTGMKEQNKVYFNSRSEFISNGYKPCSRCNP